jgi:hypothetical protein
MPPATPGTQLGLNLDRRTLVCKLHGAFRTHYMYSYIATLCRKQAEVIQNHLTPNVHAVGQGEDKILRLEFQLTTAEQLLTQGGTPEPVPVGWPSKSQRRSPPEEYSLLVQRIEERILILLSRLSESTVCCTMFQDLLH